MRLVLLLAVLLCGCRTTRVAIAPSTTRAQVLVSEQQAEVAKAAANLSAQVKKLDKVQTNNDRTLELARYIDAKATLLLKDYRSVEK